MCRVRPSRLRNSTSRPSGGSSSTTVPTSPACISGSPEQFSTATMSNSCTRRASVMSAVHLRVGRSENRAGDQARHAFAGPYDPGGTSHGRAITTFLAEMHARLDEETLAELGLEVGTAQLPEPDRFKALVATTAAAEESAARAAGTAVPEKVEALGQSSEASLGMIRCPCMVAPGVGCGDLRGARPGTPSPSAKHREDDRRTDLHSGMGRVLRPSGPANGAQPECLDEGGGSNRQGHRKVRSPPPAHCPRYLMDCVPRIPAWAMPLLKQASSELKLMGLQRA